MPSKQILRDKRYNCTLNIWIKENIDIIVFMVIFLSGILLGAIISAELAKNGIDRFITVSNRFAAQREEQQAVKTLISALIPGMLAWAAAFVGGFCAVSAPVTYLIPFIKGLGYGMFACSVIISETAAGIHYIIHLLPNLIISAIAISYCCKTSIEMSKFFWTSVNYRVKIQSDNRNMTAIFCGKMLLYGIIIIFGTIIEVYSYKIF